MNVSSIRKVLWSSASGLLLCGALVACGGGSGESASSSPVVTPVVATAPASNATGDITQTGQMNYVVYRVNAGATAIETTTLSGTVENQVSGGHGTLTLALTPTPLVVNTTDTWTNFVWPSTHKGLLSLQGNAGLVCDSTSTARTGQVGISHNMQAVTSLTELKGQTLSGYDCTSATTPTSAYTLNFLDDGSLDADGDLFDAADVAALFTAAGLDAGNGQRLRLRAYKTQLAGETRYAAVLMFVETDTTTNAVRSLGVELLLN